MYCPECGYKINEQDAVFCPECGTKITEDFSLGTTAKENIHAHGLVFTDIKRLATKLNTQEDVIRNLLETYIDARKIYGISYRIIDASNYSSETKQAQLDCSSDVNDYMDILTDAYSYQPDRHMMQYLFIIGGNDIIPMPRITHYCNDIKDKTIDTDILYAFPYGKGLIPSLENAHIFQLEQAFLVGRLPLGEDTTFDDFFNYFDRAVDNSDGIYITQAYGQCDPNWKNVSATVADKLISGNKFRNLDGNLSGEYYFRRLILSPEITIANVNQVFHPQAQLYYFNLHGSNALEAPQYFGVPKGQKHAHAVLHPEHISSCSVPNIIVCEACYGARFIGLDKRHSMLLSALYAQSLLFLGSSRIAWGNVDPATINDYTPIQPIFADTIATGFINSMLQGYTAGQALFIARSMVFGQDNEGCPNTVATVAEFNLFGDPSLHAVTPEILTKFKTVDKSACKSKSDFSHSKMEQIDSGNSILQLVRRAVNNNIEQIKNRISQHLYEQFGIEPRQPSSIFKVTLADGSKEFRFNYNIHPESDISMIYTVMTSEHGNIKNTIMTK